MRIFASLLILVWPFLFAPNLGFACNSELTVEQIAQEEVVFFQRHFAAKVKGWIDGRTLNYVSSLTGVPVSALRLWQNDSLPVPRITTLRKYAPNFTLALGITEVEFLAAAGYSANGYNYEWFEENIRKSHDGKVSNWSELEKVAEVDRSSIYHWKTGAGFPRRDHVRAFAVWRAQSLEGEAAKLFVEQAYANMGFLLPPENVPATFDDAEASLLASSLSSKRPETSPGVTFGTTRYDIPGFEGWFLAPANYFRTTALAAWRGSLPNAVFDKGVLNRFLESRDRPELIGQSLSRKTVQETFGEDWPAAAHAYGLSIEDVDFGEWINAALGRGDLEKLAHDTEIVFSRLKDEVTGNVRGQFKREEVIRIAMALGARKEEGLMAAGFYPTLFEYFASEAMRKR